MSKILVIGSSNTDMVIKTSRFPEPGETILGGDFFMNQGGKGANQAVTVARLHGEVDFVCKTGNDLFSKLHVVTPNKIEAENLSGIRITDHETLEKAAKEIFDKGVQNVLITLSEAVRFANRAAAISIAGISVAFPVGIGLALILGVVINYIGSQKGDPLFLFIGVGLIAAAIIINALAYKKASGDNQKVSTRGILISILAGVLMSFFYRFIAASMDLDNFVSPAAGKMTPYTAVFIFSLGIISIIYAGT